MKGKHGDTVDNIWIMFAFNLLFTELLFTGFYSDVCLEVRVNCRHRWAGQIEKSLES